MSLMPSLLYIFFFYVLSIIKVNFSSYMLSVFLGSSYLMGITGFIYRFILIAIDPTKIENVKFRFTPFIAEFLKQIILITSFEILQPVIGLFSLFMLVFIKNINGLIENKNKTLFSKFHLSYLLILQIALFVLVVLSLPTGNFQKFKNILFLKDLYSLAVITSFIALNYIINTLPTTEPVTKTTFNSLLIIRYNTNQLFAFVFAMLYCFYREYSNTKLVRYLKYIKYVQNKSIISTLVYWLALGFIYSLIVDVLIVISIALKNREEKVQYPYSMLNPVLNPLENRLSLKTPLYKTKINAYKDPLFIPSLFFLSLEVLNDVLVIVNE